jgi:Mce-associated membrane protein
VTDSDADPSTTEAPDALAAAEEELVRAEERAEAARARAAELRREAEASSSEQPEPTEDADESKPEASRLSRRWRWRLRRPSRTTVGVGTAIALICASMAASGYIVWQHRTLAQQRQHAAEVVAVVREEVATLMSIDPAHAVENLQHTIDDTTGALRSQLEATSSYMAKSAQDAQVTTKAIVQDVAVESMTDNSAVVLVVAKSDTVNPDKSVRPPIFWRLSINIDRDGDRLKMSKLDFVK